MSAHTLPIQTVLAFLAGVLAGRAMKRIECAWRGHEPVRNQLGGFRCSRCGKAGRDMDDLGGDGTLREARNFSRANGGEYVRGAAWVAPDDRARRSGL